MPLDMNWMFFTLLHLDDRGNMDGEPHQFMLDFDFSYEKIISKPTTKGST